MKNITYILLLFSLSLFGQRPNNFNDSTNFARPVRFAVPPYIIQGAGNGKVLTSDANGRATWQTFSSSGVTQQALNDSIARLDSTINAIPTPLLTLTDDSLNISGGNTIELPYIPLSGTEVGKPVTGDIEVGADDYVSIIKSAGSDGGKELKIGFFDDSGLFLQTKANGYDGNVYISENRIQINSNSPTSVGLTSPTDFTANITDLDYTQKKYVDQRISDTATQIRSEIPDVSNFATKTNLADTSALLRSLIPATATFTISKNSAKDSIVTVFNGTRSAVKDSIANLTNYVTTSSTSTLTNKRITARVDSTTSSATPTINTDNVDTYKLTAQAADITSFTTNLSGTPTDDQILHIVIIGTATRAITWGTKFEASTVALPTTTSGTTRLDVYFIWNTATSKWRCGGVW